MTDELDSIILKPARWQLDDYLKAKKAIQALIAKECNKARIEMLQWALNDYNMSDTDTKANLEQFIAELSNKENK